MPLKIEDAPNLVPRHGRIFVKRADRQASSAFGIIIPDNARASFRPSNAEVKAVGSGVVEFEVGDMLVLGAGVGRKVVFEDHGRPVETWESISPAMVMLKIGNVEVSHPKAHALRGIAPDETVISEDESEVDEGSTDAVV